MAPRDPPYELIADGLRAGDVIPFFGAAASAVYRPPNAAWEAGKPFLPFGNELAKALAHAAKFPVSATSPVALSDVACALAAMAWHCDDDRQLVSSDKTLAALAPALSHIGAPADLALIASWAVNYQSSRRAIERKLHESFAVDCRPGLLHEKLAAVEAALLYVTTNYDDLLEQALAARKPHIIVDRGEKGPRVLVEGKALPVSPTGEDLYGLLDDQNTHKPSRPIVFKMHGSVDRSDASNDSFLITEEDYVDFLGRAGGSYIPTYVNALMQGKDFLFLGYSLEDWNVRVILRKLLTRAAAGSVKFYAIVDGPSEVEQQVWQAQNLNIYPMDLLTFAEELARHL